ncbi:IS30 family transposase [Furfurilactobacillus siliginis]|uniref:IS30 family transposase n=1 Tax=Furfurilactobacillus siliginis TaxID=348151 RepID=A0A0R2KTW6_9LACO|nr:IS30 family transposase [Furfurilactobacillus siliginis]KRN92926.1 Integrase catalytic region [Furfurilactobacillus siliginis]GEK29687.1 IS30 family transposase [Furfurilactobacillus siliginis]
MSYHHLTIYERESILIGRIRGDSIRKIAQKLQRNPSTILREIRRGRSGRHEYSPTRAQNKYLRLRKKCHKPALLPLDPKLRVLIGHYIEKKHWSPDEISHRFKIEGAANISATTIYRDINRYNLGRPKTRRGDYGLRGFLRHRGKTRHPKGQLRQKRPEVNYIPIQERPNFINNRTRIGDWELDTVLGKTAESLLVTLVERKTRYSLIGRAKSKTALEINRVVFELLSTIPKEFVLSITPDHGTEFLMLDEISDDLSAVIYWPDTYSPQQRGTNENTNGLIREYFPRNQSIDLRTNDDIKSCQESLNRRPRRVLNYSTPSEIFFDKVLHLV